MCTHIIDNTHNKSIKWTAKIAATYFNLMVNIIKYLLIIYIVYVPLSANAEAFVCVGKDGKKIYTDKPDECKDPEVVELKKSKWPVIRKDNVQDSIYNIEFGSQKHKIIERYYVGTYEVGKDKIEFNFSSIKLSGRYIENYKKYFPRKVNNIYIIISRKDKDYLIKGEDIRTSTKYAIEALFTEDNEVYEYKNITFTLSLVGLSESQYLNRYNISVGMDYDGPNPFNTDKIGTTYDRYNGYLLPEQKP